MFEIAFSTPLRYVRASAFDPVLQPVDYEKDVFTPKYRYTQNFNTWRYYCREVMKGLNGRLQSTKKQVYYLEQMIVLMNQMKPLLKEQQAATLVDLVREAQKVKDLLDVSSSFRNDRQILRKLEAIYDQMMNELNPKLEGLLNSREVEKK